MVFGCICGAISFVISIFELGKAFTEKDPTMEQIAPANENNVVTEIDLNAHSN